MAEPRRFFQLHLMNSGCDELACGVMERSRMIAGKVSNADRPEIRLMRSRSIVIVVIVVIVVTGDRVAGGGAPRTWDDA